MADEGQEREEGLPELVNRLRSKLGALRSLFRASGTEYFRKRLLEEASRCQRYNHYCSVLVLRSQKTDPHEVYNRTRPLLRVTDIVEVVEPADNAPKEEPALRASGDWQTGETDGARRTAAILVETDRGGSETVVRRLKEALPDMADVGFGFAVYPDDSTSPHELWRIANAAAA